MSLRSGTFDRAGLAAAAAGLAALLLACSAQPVSTPMTLELPSRLAVASTDVAGVYDAVAAYAADVALPADAGQTAKARGTYVSQRVRCAPNGDERHTAWCVFRFTVTPAPDNPLQTSVLMKVSIPERVDYDPQVALRQIPIEPTLDRLVTRLSDRFGGATVAQTEPLTF